jgi:hypothetical protein
MQWKAGLDAPYAAERDGKVCKALHNRPCQQLDKPPEVRSTFCLQHRRMAQACQHLILRHGYKRDARIPFSAIHTALHCETAWSHTVVRIACSG